MGPGDFPFADTIVEVLTEENTWDESLVTRVRIRTTTHLILRALYIKAKDYVEEAGPTMFV